MSNTEVQAIPGDSASDDELRAWDWRAELRAQDRSVPWLARQTNRAAQTLYQVSSGQSRPSIEWLKSAASVLRSGGVRS